MKYNMGKVTLQTKQRIVVLHKANFKPYQIHRRLIEEGVSISQSMVRFVIKQFMEGNTLVPKMYKKRYMKVSMEHRLHFAEHFRIWANRGCSLQVNIHVLTCIYTVHTVCTCTLITFYYSIK